MRLSLPERIPVPYAVAFGLLIVVVQYFEHTDPRFSMLFLAFVVLSAFAFNTARGFEWASGAYIFWFALLTCIVGVTIKAFTGQPGESYLRAPLLTMSIYTVSIALMWLTISVHRVVTQGRSSLVEWIAADRVDSGLVARGALLLGIALFVMNLFPFLPGGLLSAVNQLNRFMPLALLFGTIDVMQKSNGRKSFGWTNGIAASLILLTGLTAYSKQDLFIPLVVWLMSAAYTRMPLRWTHAAAFTSAALFSLFVLYPYAQLGRGTDAPDAGYSERLVNSWFILTHLSTIESTTAEHQIEENHGYSPDQGYFNAPLGPRDRSTIISPDDQLISFTERNHAFFGYGPVASAFSNWVPHVLYPDKEKFFSPGNGNWYSHEMGTISPDDYTTGISFSPMAEAFHLGGWEGVVLLQPPLWLLLFLTTDLICGSRRSSPWLLLPTLFFTHVAPESLLIGLIYYIGYINLSFVLAILAGRFILPKLATLVQRPSLKVAEHALPVA